MKTIQFFTMLVLALSSCTHVVKPPAEAKKMETVHDNHSYAKPEEAVVKHLDLNLKVDFDKKQLAGTATLTIEKKAGARDLHLDIKGLTIEEVLFDDGQQGSFATVHEDPIMGTDLKIDLLPSTKKVTIHYSTSPDAAALQWLSPEQTAGGKTPFLFTQSQAILARTWIPLQDSPGIRFTYNATITVPKGLMALMSAENDSVIHPDGVYHFKMPQPVPSYLMALAVGDLKFKALDNRSGVFAEPPTLDKAAWEFVDMPRMIHAAEELYGPYAWGRYDVLVLPPSFPFGGMENPRITFATPTILAGDRSLVSLIAHELAHSWSGNLVTNATWNDFWLNEGFTVYFESRIMEKLYGKPYADMLTVLGRGELENTINELGAKSKDTHLLLDLDGRDPDDGMNDIAYEKGRFFLLSIEQKVGRERMDAFLKNYFTSHAFHSMTTAGFLADLESNLIKGDDKLRASIHAEQWINQPGLPDDCPVVKSTELDKAADMATSFKSGTAATKLNTQSWTTHHWLYFLRQLGQQIDHQKMKELDDAFHFTGSGNSEILFQWLLLSIRSGYTEADASLEHFLTTVGRRKFVRPLYGALAATPEGKKKALAIYAKARAGYHAVTAQTIDELLQ